jgi:chaperonin cofactor prefoldin
MEGIVAILSLFVVLPGIIFSFIHHAKKQKVEVEKLKYQKEILELEVQKQNNQIKLLEEESKKLDKIIYENR